MIQINKPQKYYAVLVLFVCSAIIVFPIIFVTKSLGMLFFSGLLYVPVAWYLLQTGRTYEITADGVAVTWSGIIKREHAWQDVSIYICNLKEKACLYRKYIILTTSKIPVPLPNSFWFEVRARRYYLIEYTNELELEFRNTITDVKIEFI